MRRTLQTEEVAPLLNAPPVVEEVMARELYTANALPVRKTQTLAELQVVQQSLAPVLQTPAQVAQQAKAHKRAKALEATVNGDGGPYQHFADVFETFAFALASGMAESDALRRAAQSAPADIQGLFADVAASVERGLTLTEALKVHDAGLPEIVVPIFENGLIYGTAENASRQLALALNRLARVEEKFQYSALNTGLAMPLALGLALVLFAPLFIENAALFAICIALYIGASALFWKFRHKLARRNSKGNTLRASKLRGWGKGYVRRQMGAARWSRTFAALWQCGVPISAALEAAGRSAHNAYYEGVLREAARSARGGMSLADSLAHVGLLQGNMLETIRTGELTGDLGPCLEQHADMLEADACERGGQVLFLSTFGVLFLMALALCIVCLILSWFMFGANTAALHKQSG